MIQTVLLFVFFFEKFPDLLHLIITGFSSTTVDEPISKITKPLRKYN